jgi:phosphoribosylanthranilate isomerase
VRTPRVKICCISSHAEAALAICYGAAAIGLVSKMPGGPGVIDEDLIAAIAARTPPPIATFLLTCQQDAAEIIAQQRRLRANTLQLVDRVELSAYRELRRHLPGIALVQVIHVVDEESITEAQTVAPHVDALLLDSGNQSLPIKELGGTGRTHDWTISHRICASVNKPVFLAGGLKAENVVEAIRQVQPFGLDVCSGVRTEGKLDEAKLARFMINVASVDVSSAIY